MFNKSLRYSVTAQKRERYKVLWVVLSLVSLFAAYNIASVFVFSVWAVRGGSVEGSHRTGDRLIVISSAVPFFFASLAGDRSDEIPYERGSLVMVDRSRSRDTGRNVFFIAADSIVRFFTAQQVSVFGRGEDLHMKRLLALPGDEVSMSGFVVRVKPRDSEFALTEFEFSQRAYQPLIPQMPAIMDTSLPFSGNMDPVTLGPGEYFVISDDRSNITDSRAWGPVQRRMIIGKPVLRFWPLSRIGLL